VACTAVAALIRAQRDDLMDAERLLALARSEIDREGPQWGSYCAVPAQLTAVLSGAKKRTGDQGEELWPCV
jgi:hypothetical protein